MGFTHATRRDASQPRSAKGHATSASIPATDSYLPSRESTQKPQQSYCVRLLSVFLLRSHVKKEEEKKSGQTLAKKFILTTVLQEYMTCRCFLENPQVNAEICYNNKNGMEL